MGSQEPVHLMTREATDICHLVGVFAATMQQLVRMPNKKRDHCCLPASVAINAEKTAPN